MSQRAGSKYLCLSLFYYVSKIKEGVKGMEEYMTVMTEKGIHMLGVRRRT